MTDKYFCHGRQMKITSSLHFSWKISFIYLSQNFLEFSNSMCISDWKSFLSLCICTYIRYIHMIDSESKIKFALTLNFNIVKYY